MEEEDREACRFLIVFAASCLTVRESTGGGGCFKAEARGQEARERGGGGRSMAFRGS